VTFYPSDSRPGSTDSSAPQAGLFPQISIVIPVYNGAHIISWLLDSIQQLDYPLDRYEVLVVDNNSTDDLERIDCLVHPQWLRCLQAAFQAPAVGGAAGDVQGMEPAKSWVQEVLNRRHHMSPIEQRRLSSGADQKLKLSFERPSQRLPRLLKRLGLVTYRHDSRLPLLPVAPTANIAYRREVFEQVGYFDETNHGAGDTEFAIRMQQQSNLKLVAVPEAVVYHSHRANLRQLWRAFARYEIGDVMLIETFLGLDNDVRRQLIVESIAYLIIGVPWLSVKLVFRALRSALIGPPYPLYIQDMIVNFVTLMSRHFTRIRAWNLLSQGRGGELWIP